MMKKYYVHDSIEAGTTVEEILNRQMLPYRTAEVYDARPHDVVKFFALHQDTERKVKRLFYSFHRGLKRLDPEIEPSSSLGHVYDSVSISSSLIKILVKEAKLDFSDDSVAIKLFGRQKVFSLDEMVRAYLDVLSYNKATSPLDRLHFHGVTELFSKTFRLNFPFLGEKYNPHDERSTIVGQFISDAAAHPFFNACTAARELCKHLKKKSLYRTSLNSTTNLIFEQDTDLRHVKIYEMREGILVKVLDKTSILALPKYVLNFEDNEHVRRNLPFVYLIDPYFKYVQWP